MSHRSNDSGTFRALSRHEEYFINGGDLYFLVQHVHFRVHRYFFERESPFFQRRLMVPASPGATRQGSTEFNAIVLEEPSEDFAKFLWVFYNPKYSLYNTSASDWKVILRLAHQWEFLEVKKLVVRELEKLDMDDVDRIATYQDHDIDRNLLIPRYAALCQREEPLTLHEGLKLGMETTLMIARAREYARSNPTASGARSPTAASIQEDEMHSLVRLLFEIESPAGDAESQEDGTMTPPGGLPPAPPQQAPTPPPATGKPSPPPKPKPTVVPTATGKPIPGSAPPATPTKTPTSTQTPPVPRTEAPTPPPKTEEAEKQATGRNARKNNNNNKRGKQQQAAQAPAATTPTTPSAPQPPQEEAKAGNNAEAAVGEAPPLVDVQIPMTAGAGLLSGFEQKPLEGVTNDGKDDKAKTSELEVTAGTGTADVEAKDGEPVRDGALVDTGEPEKDSSAVNAGEPDKTGKLEEAAEPEEEAKVATVAGDSEACSMV